MSKKETTANDEMTIEKKFMLSTMRAMHMVVPQNDREAELMGIAYLGAMSRCEVEMDEIVKLNIGITKGYTDLLKLAMGKE